MAKLTKLEVESIVYAIKEDFNNKRLEFILSEDFNNKKDELIQELSNKEEVKRLSELFERREELSLQLKDIDATISSLKKEVGKALNIKTGIYGNNSLATAISRIVESKLLEEAELSVPSEEKIRSKVVLSNYDGDINEIVNKVKEEL